MDNHDKYNGRGETADDANSIILRMDKEGRIVFLNEFAQKFFGYKEDEILGRSVIGTIVPATDTSGRDLKAMINDIMLHPGKYVNNENENMLRGGRRVWIAWTNKPVVDKDNRLKEVLCVGNDITKLRQAMEDRFETVVQDLSEGVVLCNPDWSVKYANTAAREYLGIKRPERRSFKEVVSSNYSVSISMEKLSDLSAPHKKFDVVRRESEQFKALYLEADLNILKNGRGETENIVILFRNVTEARREEALKQGFLDLVSHKLNTPATVINQASLMLQAGGLGGLPPKQKKYIDEIVDESFRLRTLVANLIAFATVNSKELRFAREPIELHTYLPQLADILAVIARDKKVEFNIECAHKDLVVNMSREYFDLIMHNLVDNAVKFNDKEAVIINIVANKGAGRLEITVADNGRGIPPEDYDKIFEKFYQIEKYFTGNIPGAGLGLSLVKRLVSGHGGSVRLESELGKGSKFTISLPV